MRVLIQRVKKAAVHIDGEVHSKIKHGLLIFVAIHKEDTEKEAVWLADKCVSLRIFEDNDFKMNQSVQDVDGEILIVSQFTLYGNCKAGRRPEFTESARGMSARKLYDFFVQEVKKKFSKVETGVFAANMQIDLLNDGPVTLMVEK